MHYGLNGQRCFETNVGCHGFSAPGWQHNTAWKSGTITTLDFGPCRVVGDKAQSVVQSSDVSLCPRPPRLPLHLIDSTLGHSQLMMEQ